MNSKYSLKEIKEGMVKAYGRDLPISTKKSVEICDNLRGKTLSKAKRQLEGVISGKSALPMKKFIRDTPHKRGIGPGRYPIKTAEQILVILESAESNAQNQGLSTKDLVVYHICAHKASRPWHFGRKRRIKMKRTHIEVVLVEQKTESQKKEAPAKKKEASEKKASDKKPDQKETPK